VLRNLDLKLAARNSNPESGMAILDPDPVFVLGQEPKILTPVSTVRQNHSVLEGLEVVTVYFVFINKSINHSSVAYDVLVPYGTN
jgi:hypothetical protein